MLLNAGVLSNPVVSGGDPFFSSVVLLLSSGGGTPGATTTVDYSNLNNTVTFSGSAVISGSSSPFGDTSFRFTKNSTTYIQASSGYSLSSDFTVEFWLREDASESYGWWAYLSNRGSATASIPHQAFHEIGGTILFSGVLSVGAWNHYALVRSGSSFNFYVNGVYNSGNTMTAVLTPSYIRIGWKENVGLNGYMDEFRITNGVARYLSNFSVPAERFPRG